MPGPQPLAPTRKSPAQSRSKATVVALVEAAAQILERAGEPAVTTKSVAERAGVSIGTLYQYFDDRDALLLAVADGERQRLARRLQSLIEAPESRNLADALHEFIAALIASFVRRRGARRQFELLATLGLREDVENAFHRALAAHFRAAEPDADATAIEARAFVLTFAIQGVMRAAAAANSPLLREPAFADALLSMVRSLAPRRRAARKS